MCTSTDVVYTQLEAPELRVVAAPRAGNRVEAMAGGDRFAPAVPADVDDRAAWVATKRQVPRCWCSPAALCEIHVTHIFRATELRAEDDTAQRRVRRCDGLGPPRLQQEARDGVASRDDHTRESRSQSRGPAFTSDA